MLPAPLVPVPDPGLPGIRLPGSLSLPHSVEVASALQGPWTTLSNFTGRASDAQVSDPEGKGPLRMTEVEDAQKKIMRQARKLSEKGELILASGGADFV